jgi:hypothetical protein
LLDVDADRADLELRLIAQSRRPAFHNPSMREALFLALQFHKIVQFAFSDSTPA